MPKNQQDVKLEQGSSPAQGVMADSPTADDVKAPDSSTGEGAAGQKPHEDFIPYSRFKEEIEKSNQLKAELEALKAQYIDQPPQSFDWDSLYPTDSGRTQPQSAPAAPVQQPVFSPEQIEERLREDIYQKPFQTLYPIMLEAAKQVFKEQKKQEARIRSIPDFKNYESDYYSVPEDIVAQAQSDPELIRFLLAKHRATASGKVPPPTPAKIAAQTASSSSSNGPSNSPATMEELAERYRREGEQRILERIKSQQGMTAEGAATFPQSTSDEPELDEQGKALMAKLGIPQERIKNVASRLENFLKGK